MTEQLALFDLKQVTFAPVPTYTLDPSWDEITQQEDSGVGGHDEIPPDDCPPTIQVGDRVQLHCPFMPDPPLFGTLVSVSGQQAFVRWEPYGGSHINVEFLQLAHQQTSTCESVGGQVENDTSNFAHQHDNFAHQHDNFAHQHNGWVEKYSVTRNENKYYYWRFTWREGNKKRRRYIGSCDNPKARERVEMVKIAIALGKPPHEIVELITS